MAQPIPQPPTNNGSTTYFQGLTQNTAVLTQNYNFGKAFQRAMKVFLMSYPEVNMVNSLPVLMQRYNEYLREMTELYNQRQPDMSFLQQMKTDIRQEEYYIEISCKKVVGMNLLRNPEFVVTFEGQKMERTLFRTAGVQPYQPIRITVGYDLYHILRNDINQRIVISIEESRPPSMAGQQQPLTVFNLICAHTHPEGFEDWIDFGRGVRLLINVIYKVKDEPNVTVQEVSTFHLRTIELMLRRRLEVYSTTTGALGRPHQMAARKHKICYQRQYINKQTDSYFWIRPEFGTTPSWFSASDTYITPRKTTVRPIDMQIGFETNQDFEDRVCLCNEWCNWSAFFYHNPIYRFLMVRHHQLYLRNMSNIPNMYLCATVLLGCAPTLQKPILPLMYSANEYRKQFYDNFYCKSAQHISFRFNYSFSYPSPKVMDGLTYNKLRNELNVTELCHLLNRNPFADICIENLIHYYDVLISLHLQMSMEPQCVSDKDLWAKDMDVLGRNNYSDYLKQSYDKCCAEIILGNDFIFTDDFEYTTQLSKTTALHEIRKVRERVKLSPLNVSIRTSDFLNSFSSVYKFLAKVEPILPSTYKKEGRTLLLNCYQRMDTDFEGFRNMFNEFDFELDSTKSGFNNLQQNFEVFYTLKLYFYAFEIQKHCINAVLKYNIRERVKTNQVSSRFNFIWNQVFIEQNYRTKYPGQMLFNIDDFDTLFVGFYQQFWGRAQHEALQLNSVFHIIASGHFQYQRLYFWLRNDGNNRRKFVKIIQSFNDCLKNIVQTSDQIMYTQIMPALAHLIPTYMDSAEVFDHLVYYLVKANCSVILSSVAMFFRPMHDLQVDRLVTTDVSYSLCKPGWIDLFKTLSSVLTALDVLRTDYIVFDDEFNRISNTFNQTKQMIKDIYRQFYAKLTYEWMRELRYCLERMNNPNRNMVEFVQVHLAVGLAFSARFCDTFRFDFAYSRKLLFVRLNTPVRHHLQHQTAFTQCIQVVENYLKDRQMIASAQPFTCNLWRQQLFQIIASFNQMSGQQLNIDLNAANV